jgi:hypothetical protein
MRRFATLFCLALFACAAIGADAPFREIKWEELVPKGWDPAKEFRNTKLKDLQDSDPRAMELLDRLKQAWDSAPTEPALDGARVKLPGFIIPMERKGERISEFLLVPYFGACIHSPPPPANQIIHVVAKQPLKNMMTMSAVWASGTLSLQRSDSPWGMSGYRMVAEVVVPYEEPGKRK